MDDLSHHDRTGSRAFNAHRQRCSRRQILRTRRRKQAGKCVAHDTIFLTRWSNSWSHVLIEPVQVPCDEKRGEELFPNSKNRAKRVYVVPLSSIGLGGEWQGLHITRG